jgi:hypothetical protein
MGNSNNHVASTPQTGYAAQVIPQIAAHNQQPVMVPNGNRVTRVLPTERVYRSETYTASKRAENEDRLNRYASGNPKTGWRAMQAATGNTPSVGDAKLAYETQTAASKALINSLTSVSANKYAMSNSLKSKSVRYTKYDPKDTSRPDLGVLNQKPLNPGLRGLDPGKIDAIQGEQERLRMGLGQVYTARASR